MKEYKFNNVTVRIHGEVNQEKLKEACIKFMNAVHRDKKLSTPLKKRGQNVDKMQKSVD